MFETIDETYQLPSDQDPVQLPNVFPSTSKILFRPSVTQSLMLGITMTMWSPLIHKILHRRYKALTALLFTPLSTIILNSDYDMDQCTF